MKIIILFCSILICSTSAFAQSYIKDMKRDSARSDTRTGGTIEKAALVAGGKDIKITINVPAFQMTLWQNGKEVKSYPIGADQGIPDLYRVKGNKDADMESVVDSPDSEWVAEGLRGVPIAPTDPRNPLGKMKIPLGYGYLLHQAKGADDLGSLVSHGCVRVMRDDIYDLSKKLSRRVNLKFQMRKFKKRNKQKLPSLPKWIRPFRSKSLTTRWSSRTACFIFTRTFTNGERTISKFCAKN